MVEFSLANLWKSCIWIIFPLPLPVSQNEVWMKKSAAVYLLPLVEGEQVFYYFKTTHQTELSWAVS